MQSKRVLRTDAAAEYVALKPSTLEKMRVRGDGPRFIKLGSRAVGYLVADLDSWLDGQRSVEPTETPATARR
jgi:predicted DNA-binding transcriptional regulator AlpA